MTRDVIMVVSSYGRDYISFCQGQANIIKTVYESKANGVEIRRELLLENVFLDLQNISKEIQKYELLCFYSVPDVLFMETGILNPKINAYLEEAKLLKAQYVKFSLGHYHYSESEYIALKNLCKTYEDVQIFVENDQEFYSTIESFESFFQLETSIKMTFDTGNWLCLEIDALSAAQRLSQFVGYIHVKAGQKTSENKIVALSPQKNDEWMKLLTYLPAEVPRGIEFMIKEPVLINSQNAVELLKND